MKMGEWEWGPEFGWNEFADPKETVNSGLNMKSEFMNKLYSLRQKVGSAIIINPNGGFSTSGHAPKSAHYVGLAADIRVPGIPIDILSNKIRTVGFNGVGFYPHWEPIAGFHLDMAERKARWVRIEDGTYVSLT